MPTPPSSSCRTSLLAPSPARARYTAHARQRGAGNHRPRQTTARPKPRADVERYAARSDRPRTAGRRSGRRGGRPKPAASVRHSASRAPRQDLLQAQGRVPPDAAREASSRVLTMSTSSSNQRARAHQPRKRRNPPTFVSGFRQDDSPSLLTEPQRAPHAAFSAQRVPMSPGAIRRRRDLCVHSRAQGRKNGVLCLVDRLGCKVDGEECVGLRPIGIVCGDISLDRRLLGVHSLAHSLVVLIPVALDLLPVGVCLLRGFLPLARSSAARVSARLRASSSLASSASLSCEAAALTLWSASSTCLRSSVKLFDTAMSSSFERGLVVATPRCPREWTPRAATTRVNRTRRSVPLTSVFPRTVRRGNY